MFRKIRRLDIYINEDKIAILIPQDSKKKPIDYRINKENILVNVMPGTRRYAFFLTEWRLVLKTTNMQSFALPGSSGSVVFDNWKNCWI